MIDTPTEVRQHAAVIREAIRALAAARDDELAEQAHDPVVLARLLQASALVDAARAAHAGSSGELRAAYADLLELAPEYMAGVRRLLDLRRGDR